MKNYLTTFLIIIVISLSDFGFSQVISSQKYGFEYNSIYTEEETFQINNFINQQVERIEFVQLLPFCKESKTYDDSTGEYLINKSCYFKSILSVSETDQSIRPSTVNLNSTKNNTVISPSDYASIFQSLYSQNKAQTTTSYCYEPRHGICFYGKKNKLLGFVEICFACSIAMTTNQIPENKPLTNSGFKTLASLFKKYGLDKVEY